MGHDNIISALLTDRRTPAEKRHDRRIEILTLCLVGIVVVGILVLAIVGAVHIVELLKSHLLWT
jgi:hypothetical protein